MLAVGQILGVDRAGRTLPPPPKVDDGQSIKTFDRSHYEFRLILHRRLITRARYIFIPLLPAPPLPTHPRAYVMSGKGAGTVSAARGREGRTEGEADDATAPPHSKWSHFTRSQRGAAGRTEKERDVIDYGNIFSVGQSQTRHVPPLLSVGGHPDCDLQMMPLGLSSGCSCPSALFCCPPHDAAFS